MVSVLGDKELFDDLSAALGSREKQAMYVFYWSFMVIVYMLLLNIFLSIVVDAFINVKDETTQVTRPQRRSVAERVETVCCVSVVSSVQCEFSFASHFIAIGFDPFVQPGRCCPVSVEAVFVLSLSAPGVDGPSNSPLISLALSSLIAPALVACARVHPWRVALTVQTEPFWESLWIDLQWRIELAYNCCRAKPDQDKPHEPMLRKSSFMALFQPKGASVKVSAAPSAVQPEAGGAGAAESKAGNAQAPKRTATMSTFVRMGAFGTVTYCLRQLRAEGMSMSGIVRTPGRACQCASARHRLLCFASRKESPSYPWCQPRFDGDCPPH